MIIAALASLLLPQSCSASTPASRRMLAATWPRCSSEVAPVTSIRPVTRPCAVPYAECGLRLSNKSSQPSLRFPAGLSPTGERAGPDMLCSRSATVCRCCASASLLTPTVLCGAALLRLQSALASISMASLRHAAKASPQLGALPLALRAHPPLAAPTTHVMRASCPPGFGAQPTSGASHHPGHHFFREDLMHELLKQLPAEGTPRKRGAHLPPAHALASEHFSTCMDQERDCAVCSRRAVRRVQTHLVCAACQVHLCLGACFAQYHA
jgi:hypothetical protein